MSNHSASSTQVHRRTFIAASSLAIPAIALSASAASAFTNADSEFHQLMKQLGRNYKSLRAPMRKLEQDHEWNDAAFLANQSTILLAQCIEVADKMSIPSQSKEQYSGNQDQFIVDFKISLADTAAQYITLSKALWMRDKKTATEAFAQLRPIRNEAHGIFKEDN